MLGFKPFGLAAGVIFLGGPCLLSDLARRLKVADVYIIYYIYNMAVGKHRGGIPCPD